MAAKEWKIRSANLDPEWQEVELAPGIIAKSPWHLGAIGGDYRADLEVVALPMKGEEVGRWICEAVTVRRRRTDGPPVTSEAIRSVPIALLVKGLSSREWLLGGDHKPIDDATAARLRREGPTDETLKWVALAYRQALVLGDSPTRAVERALNLPRSTAGNWISIARQPERGFLGPTEGQGKASG